MGIIKRKRKIDRGRSTVITINPNDFFSRNKHVMTLSSAQSVSRELSARYIFPDAAVVVDNISLDFGYLVQQS